MWGNVDKIDNVDSTVDISDKMVDNKVPSEDDVKNAGEKFVDWLNANPTTQKILKTAEELWIEEKEITKKLSVIDTSVATTKKNLPSKFRAIQEKIKKWEVLSLFSDFGALVAFIINVMFNDGKDSEGKIIEWALDIKKLDFNEYSLAQLGGNIAKQSFPELSKNDTTADSNTSWEKKSEPEWGKKSLIGQLMEKANSWDLSDQIMYTAALSKAKDTFYAKYKKREDTWKDTNNINPKLTEEELKSLNDGSTRYEEIEQNVQPWDMVFFIAGDSARQKRYDSALAMASTLPIYHVGIVGEWWSFYHSTMKDQGTGYAGAHKVSFKEELDSRQPCKVLVVRPNTDADKMLTAAQNMVDKRMEYSKKDALTSLVGLWDIDGKKKVNCGDFVNTALQASWVMWIKNAGAPSNIIETGQEKNLWFTNQYLGNYN